MAAQRPLERRAFYALKEGGWRDFVTLLHPPYTAWHLSFVAIGAGVAPTVRLDRMAWTLGGFFLGVGVCAHALDELRGRPLNTKLPSSTLAALATLSLAGAVAIGIYGTLTVSVTIAALVAAGLFIVLAYNLELFNGRFHTDFWFAASWGGFPALAGFWACCQRIDAQLVLAMCACFALSLLQRRLSTPVRKLRRKTMSIEGTQLLLDGTEEPLSARGIAEPMEGALKAGAAATMLLAAALVLARM